MLIALAHAVWLQRHSADPGNNVAGDLEAAAAAVKQSFSECPSYDKLVRPGLVNPAPANAAIFPSKRV